MQSSFQKLSEPGQIGNVNLKNRIIKAPQHTGLANPDGSVTDRLLRHYKELALGGPAMVIVEYAWVDNDASKASPCQLGIARIEHMPGAGPPGNDVRRNPRGRQSLRSSRETGPNRRFRHG
ncbi:MAG: hypothetical protein M1274_09535 [Actinobacteria bacterium]|nr:hypothetical protein [Actinomycetota bacterium]